MAETETESGTAPNGKRARDSEERRRRILEAARACFGEGGFAGAKIERIAARAGVSNGLLYQFFRNKEHLFEEVIDELQRDWVRAMLPRGDTPRSSLDALDAMLRRSVAFAATHPLLPALLTEDRALQLGRLQRKHGRLQAYRDHVAGVLREGIGAGELRADLDVPSVADIICQLHIDYATRAWRRDPEYPADPGLIDAAVRFIRDAVARA